MLTAPQARAVRRLRIMKYEPGAVIDIGALWAANGPQDVADRRCLRTLADLGYFIRQGTRNAWRIRPELYSALDSYDAQKHAAYQRRII
jgi:DNA-binding IclR family transcriptional regulator